MSERCLSPLGREKVEEMRFLSSYGEITSRLAETEEFTRIREEEDSFPADHFYDMRPVLHRIRLEGAWIDQKDLLELRRSLQTINGVVAFLRRDQENAKYPHLLALAGDVTTFPEVTKRIDSILDNFGQVKDNASPKLSEIRRSLASAINGISKSVIPY